MQGSNLIFYRLASCHPADPGHRGSPSCHRRQPCRAKAFGRAVGRRAARQPVDPRLGAGTLAIPATRADTVGPDSSVVFQDPVLDRPLTGRQNLQLHLRLWRVPKAEGLARLAELTAAVGLAGLLDRPVATYSGG
jgi:energy-coupling factor transporter ATP-binding protein EcfA2